jgi:phosphohistidine phosphatase
METVVLEKTLYECLPVDILNCAKKTDDAHDTLCIIGHNPSITDFVNNYTNTFLIHVPTSGAVCVAFDVRSWAEIPKVKGRVVWSLKPKEVTTVCP